MVGQGVWVAHMGWMGLESKEDGLDLEGSGLPTWLNKISCFYFFLFLYILQNNKGVWLNNVIFIVGGNN